MKTNDLSICRQIVPLLAAVCSWLQCVGEPQRTVSKSGFIYHAAWPTLGLPVKSIRFQLVNELVESSAIINNCH